MIFDIIYPRNPDVDAVVFRQTDSQAYDACDLIDLLLECGFGRMSPFLLNYNGYENAVEVSTKASDYISRARVTIKEA